jgi:hypothetical protein
VAKLATERATERGLDYRVALQEILAWLKEHAPSVLAEFQHERRTAA